MQKNRFDIGYDTSPLLRRDIPLWKKIREQTPGLAHDQEIPDHGEYHCDCDCDCDIQIVVVSEKQDSEYR